MENGFVMPPFQRKTSLENDNTLSHGFDEKQWQIAKKMIPPQKNRTKQP